MTVDLEKQTVTDDSGLSYSFEVDPFRRDCLLRGLDDIGLTLVHDPHITGFERKNLRLPVMYDPVDVKYHKQEPPEHN